MNLKLKTMKTTILLLIGFLLLNCSIAGSNEEIKQNPSLDGETNVYCSPDLYNLTTIWVSEFCSFNPNLKINVIKVTESSVAKSLNQDGDLSFISNEYYSGLHEKSIWKMEIGRDVIVPIINSKNPFLAEIYATGISSEKFAQIFKNPEMLKWGTLLEKGKNTPINYYMINDESVNSALRNYLNENQLIIDGVIVENDQELISSIQKDPYAIGFCKMIDIVDFANHGMVENIKFLPIDKNGNGTIDYMEKIYDDLEGLSRGVWIGKYPKDLINNIYSIASVKPTNEIELAFLKWVLTDGQQFLNTNGYSDLLAMERQSKLDMLMFNEIENLSSEDNYSTAEILILILGVLIVVGFIVNIVVKRSKYKKPTFQDASSIFPLVFDENSVEVPKGLYFDKTHTWAFMEKDGAVRIGIDDFLQHITGPLTRIKMKNAGEKIKKGEQILSIIQNGKQLHINSPISGIIKTQNETLITNSSIMNSSPYSDGWAYMIEPTNWLKEIQFLIMEKKYKEWLTNEFARLKDFLAVFIKPNSDEYFVLQDGGEIKDSILANLGPEVWEDFQTNFIDNSR